MRARSGFLCFAALVIAGAIAVTILARSRLGRLRAADARMRQTLEALERRAAMAGAEAKAGKSDGKPSSAATEPRSGATPPASLGNAGIAPEELVAMDPALRARYLQLKHDSLDVRWGLLFQMLHLSPDQIVRFKDLQSRLLANELQAAQAAAERGLSPSDPEIESLEGGLDRPVDHELRSLLGEAGYGEYREYRRDRAVIPVVQDLAAYAGSEPLTLDQAASLIPILADASDKTPRGAPLKGAINSGPAMSGASAVLAPGQLSVLGALLSKAEARRQIELLSSGR